VNEITGNAVILGNTFLLIVLGLVQIVKIFIDRNTIKKQDNTNGIDAEKFNSLVDTVNEIKEVLEQEKIIDSMSKMAAIQKATIEILQKTQSKQDK
jgi:hypothetical protein